MDGDKGRYRNWVEEVRWRHADGRHANGIATTVVTEDLPAPGVAARPAQRFLRIRPSTPPPDFSTFDGGQVVGEHIDLLEINLEVRRNPPPLPDGEIPPQDFGQGESILLSRDQAVVLRRALDAFVADAVVLLPDEAEREAIAARIRSTGDPFA